jgi:hypothetical protein
MGKWQKLHGSGVKETTYVGQEFSIRVQGNQGSLMGIIAPKKGIYMTKFF